MASLRDLAERLKGFVMNYNQQVQQGKQQPFFGPGNSPIQWAGKVAQDVRQRGPIEGIHDLSYPVMMNPYIHPIGEPLISNTRMFVSRIPNQAPPTQLFRKLLGLPPTINTIPWPKQ